MEPHLKMGGVVLVGGGSKENRYGLA